jgi:hypothetical protein
MLETGQGRRGMKKKIVWRGVEVGLGSGVGVLGERLRSQPREARDMRIISRLRIRLAVVLLFDLKIPSYSPCR